jgi:hypothetical protein
MFGPFLPPLIPSFSLLAPLQERGGGEISTQPPQEKSSRSNQQPQHCINTDSLHHQKPTHKMDSKIQILQKVSQDPTFLTDAAKKTAQRPEDWNSERKNRILKKQAPRLASRRRRTRWVSQIRL